MTERVVIIGSGPAGWAAAIYAARANLEPLVFEGALTQENYQQGTMPLGQLNLTTEVENYPGFPHGDLKGYLSSALPPESLSAVPEFDDPALTGPRLMHLMRQQAKNFGTRVITDDILEVDLSSRPFKLKSLDGIQTEAHSIIIATGARANYLGLPSEDKYKNAGVSACAVCDGGLPRFKSKPLVVVGGGDSAMEEATYLTKFASTVYLVHRRGEFRASKIMAQRVLDNPKITVKWFTGVEEVLGDEKLGVIGVRLKDLKSGVTEDVAASGMFCAIGHTPNTNFLNGQLQTDDKGYIVYTKAFRTDTSVEGVFAAGDVADSYYRQAITSAGTGCMAALDAERWLGAQGVH
ncbi:MAG: thioredoxin reductase [Schlesneria sp.]|nr:thioredoxin reductase [Schlesneria sp.]